MDPFIKTIIDKLENNTELTEAEKSYIEKAIMMVAYYEDLLDMNLGLRENTAGLKFGVYPLVPAAGCHYSISSNENKDQNYERFWHIDWYCCNYHGYRIF